MPASIRKQKHYTVYFALSTFQHPKNARGECGGGAKPADKREVVTNEKKLRKEILLNTKLLQCNMFIKKVSSPKKKKKEVKATSESEDEGMKRAK